MLTRIAATPCAQGGSDGWRLVARQHHGVVYLCELRTASTVSRERNRTSKQRRMAYWGYKFEQYMQTEAPDVGLSDAPSNSQYSRMQLLQADEPSDLSAPVNSHDQFNVVLRARLGKVRLLYSAETDALLSDGRWCELKTQRKLDNHDHLVNFHRWSTYDSCQYLFYILFQIQNMQMVASVVSVRRRCYYSRLSRRQRPRAAR